MHNKMNGTCLKKLPMYTTESQAVYNETIDRIDAFKYL